jgi:hypothetical protein
MYNVNLGIAKIQKTLANAIKAKVLPVANIYAGNRPTNNPAGNFIVISIPGQVIDMTAYGTCYLSVDIYTKALEDGRKDLNEEEKIHDKLIELLPVYTDKYTFDLSKMAEIDMGSDGQYYFCNRISLDCFVKNR